MRFPENGLSSGPSCVPAKIGTEGNLHGTQVTVTGELLIEPTASPTMDATIHLMLDKDAEVLVVIGPLFPEVASDPMATGNGHVLKQDSARLHRRQGNHGDGSS